MWVLIGPFLPCHVAFSQETWPSDSITTIGIGHMTNDNIIAAQNEAIIDAQKKSACSGSGNVDEL